jgi:hypothetical protein
MNPIFSFMPNNIVETNDSLSAEIKQDGLFNNAPSLKQEGFFFDEDFFCDELAADSFDAKKIFKEDDLSLLQRQSELAPFLMAQIVPLETQSPIFNRMGWEKISISYCPSSGFRKITSYKIKCTAPSSRRCFSCRRPPFKFRE